jgi:hypothetical protein
MTVYFNLKKSDGEYKLSGFFYDEKEAEQIIEFLTMINQKTKISIDYNRDNCFLWFGAMEITLYDATSLALLKLVSNIQFKPMMN